jgi:lipoprotein-releasing system ATP-binding protein
MNNNNNLLNVKSIKKSFYKADKEIKVLDSIDLVINSGDVIAVTGRSGAGKSTLLHVLGTLIKPDSGEIYYNGADILLYDDDELNVFRNRTLGFVFQFHYLINELTAFENILLPAMVYAEKNQLKKFEKKAFLLLEYLGLAERSTHFPYELSGGEQQRIAFARALINNPKLLFADEPTGNIDEKTSQELIELLFNLQKDFNLTILLVTHDKNIASLCNKNLVLHNGLISS